MSEKMFYPEFNFTHSGRHARSIYLLHGFDPDIKKDVYKIGFSKDPVNRVYGSGLMYWGYGFKIKILCAYNSESFIKIEKRLHLNYDKNRIYYHTDGGSEWFLLNDYSVETFIEECRRIDDKLKQSKRFFELRMIKYYIPDHINPNGATADQGKLKALELAREMRKIRLKEKNEKEFLKMLKEK